MMTTRTGPWFDSAQVGEPYMKTDGGSPSDSADHFEAQFAWASALLASGSMLARAAGVDRLAMLALNNPDSRQLCIDVLCEYVRTPIAPFSEAGWPKASEAETAADKAMEEQMCDADIRDRILVHLDGFVSGHCQLWIVRDRLAGVHLNLAGVELDEFNIACARMCAGTSIDLSGATFNGKGVLVQESTWTGGTLDLSGATFNGADCDLRASEFKEGTLNLRGATFNGGALVLSGVRFDTSTVDCTGCTFNGGPVAAARFVSSMQDQHQDGECAAAICLSNAALRGTELRFERAAFNGCAIAVAGLTVSGGYLDFNGAVLRNSEFDFSFIKYDDFSVIDLRDAELHRSQMGFLGVVPDRPLLWCAGTQFIGGSGFYYEKCVHVPSLHEVIRVERDLGK